ncbi:zinc finger CCCH domain-containing protein 62 [Phragmites australis]|uniref:zinc finger CCCH domain-containing protein 62 n=1 Tax=Phragmites australis TaxID=29695 RepID=UPI002D7781D4|nr:zinc finger CCCH domain-containing protein 62 [Phragmites australis]
MPVTTRRAATAAPVVVDEELELAAAIDISSDSDTGSESEEGSELEEDSTSDEDFSDSDAGGGEASGEGSEEEAGAGRLGADRREAACSKIAGLLRGGRNLEGIKLVECKAYLKKNGLSQTGDIATCVDRIMLHWRFKDGDPEKIYPRSSFCINCKGDVCRADAVLFKQKVYGKSGKRHAKCIGKRIVAGRVIKESYGRGKQQHTFTIQVFWSKGAGNLPPLHLLLVKGRNLYRMMTFRQPWPNEMERLKTLEEKHNRGDAARRVRALNRPKSAGNTLKGKKTLEKEKRSGRSDHGSNVTKGDKGKKRPAQSSNFDLPNKRSKKEGCQVPSGKERTGGWRANKKNCSHLDKSICTSRSSSLCNGSREKNHATLQNNCHMAPLNKGPSSTEVGMTKRNAGSEQKNSIGDRHAQFEGRFITPASHVQASHGDFVGIQHPFVGRPQLPPPLREVGNVRLPHPGGSSTACPNRPDALFNATMGFRHQNTALAGPHAPSYFRGYPPNQQRVAFPSHMPQTVYHPHSEAAYVVPHFRYLSGSTGFRR